MSSDDPLIGVMDVTAASMHARRASVKARPQRPFLRMGNCLHDRLAKPAEHHPCVHDGEEPALSNRCRRFRAPRLGNNGLPPDRLAQRRKTDQLTGVVTQAQGYVGGELDGPYERASIAQGKTSVQTTHSGGSYQ